MTEPEFVRVRRPMSRLETDSGDRPAFAAGGMKPCICGSKGSDDEGRHPLCSHHGDARRELSRRRYHDPAVTTAGAAYMRQYRADKRPAEPAAAPAHGTRTRYQSGCSCEPCRMANRDYTRQLRTGEIGPEGSLKVGVQHGTRACYVKGCRRPECTEANRLYQREYYRENYGKRTSPDG